MKSLRIVIAATLIFALPLSVPAQEKSQDVGAIREKAIAAMTARNEAFSAGDYKTACEHSHVGVAQTDLFLAHFKSVIDKAAADPDTDSATLAEARDTYAQLEEAQAKNREMDASICEDAGMTPAP